MASIFTNLFHHPMHPDGCAPASTGPPVEIYDHDESLEAIYLLAATLLGSRRGAQAAELLERFDRVAVLRSDGQSWRARSEFLKSVYAEQAADLPGILEHTAAAGRLFGAAIDGSSAGHDTRGARLLQTVDAVAAHRLPLLAARAKVGLGEPLEARALLEGTFGSLEAAEASQPATMAMVACGQGRLTDALRLASAALRTAERNDAGNELVNLEARLALAEVFFERNALEAAEEQLQAALQWCYETGAAPWTSTVQTQLARLSVAQQRAIEAIPLVEHLRQVHRTSYLPEPLVRILNKVEIDCLLQLGDVDGAVRIVRNSAPTDLDSETRGEVELCSGRPDRVMVQLRTGEAPTPAGRIRRLVLLACAEKQQGRTEKATDFIRRAVEAGQPEEYVRPFLEHATQIPPMLRNLGPFPPDTYVSRLISQSEHVASTGGASTDATLLEPLTQRERQVLQYLPSHRTTRQIAKLMFVSTNTVKTHQKNIYRKTGATSRDEAVTLARSHGLI